MTSLWLASSVITTSKRVVGSKVSTACARGMIQTGTAERHSVIFWLASTMRRGTRFPIPLPIRRTMSSQPTRDCCCCEVVRRTCAPHARRSISSAVTFLSSGPIRSICACSAGKEVFPLCSSSS